MFKKFLSKLKLKKNKSNVISALDQQVVKSKVGNKNDKNNLIQIDYKYIDLDSESILEEQIKCILKSEREFDNSVVLLKSYYDFFNYILGKNNLEPIKCSQPYCFIADEKHDTINIVQIDDYNTFVAKCKNITSDEFCLIKKMSKQNDVYILISIMWRHHCISLNILKDIDVKHIITVENSESVDNKYTIQNISLSNQISKDFFNLLNRTLCDIIVECNNEIHSRHSQNINIKKSIKSIDSASNIEETIVEIQHDDTQNQKILFNANKIKACQSTIEKVTLLQTIIENSNR